MLFNALNREVFIEVLPKAGRPLQWYFSPDENHLWIGKWHVVWNPARLTSHSAFNTHTMRSE